MTTKPVLTLKDLSIEFPTPRGVVQAVKGLNLTIQKGRRARLSAVAYIPQGAMNSLNPVMRVEPWMWDAIIAHEGSQSRAELQKRSDEALASAGLPGHTGQLFPHELSGGMKQRVCIAMGLILNHDLIIADEPTSALDVVTQRQVMQTLKDIQAQIGSGLILIGHDMGLMAQSVDELAVIKDGELVEHGTVQQIIENPQHPYTQDLISSVPLVGGASFLNPEKGAPSPARHTKEQLLRFANVRKDYGPVTALHPMSFTLEGDTPQIISIVGQSGSGKSTMGSIMLGSNQPSQGRVLFEGQDIQKMPAAQSLEFRKNVQAVFQAPMSASTCSTASITR